MCLVTKFSKTFTSKEDIKVYKKVITVGKYLDGTDRILTPFMHEDVILGQKLKASHHSLESDKPLFNPRDNSYYYTNGWIHSYINLEAINTGMYVESIIPAGTPYVISYDMEEIISKEILVGTKIKDYPEFNNSGGNNVQEDKGNLWKMIFPILDSIVEDYICPGWLLMSDGSFVHPLEVFKTESDLIKDDMDIAGVVYQVLNRDNYIVQVISYKSFPVNLGFKYIYPISKENFYSQHSDEMNELSHFYNEDNISAFIKKIIDLFNMNQNDEFKVLNEKYHYNKNWELPTSNTIYDIDKNYQYYYLFEFFQHGFKYSLGTDYILKYGMEKDDCGSDVLTIKSSIANNLIVKFVRNFKVKTIKFDKLVGIKF